MLAAAQMRTTRGPQRTLKMQQHNDRTAAKGAIQKKIADLRSYGVWGNMMLEERRTVIVEEYRRKIRERGGNEWVQSAKVYHPEHYDEKSELRKMIQKFESQIEEGLEKSKLQEAGGKQKSYQEESDEDDEEMPIKSEDREDEDGSSENGESSGSESGSETETETETETEYAETESWRESESAGAESDDASHGRPKHSVAARPVSSATRKRSAPVEDDKQVKKTVVYTAISRGMAMDQNSGAKRARSVGWPWFKVAGA